MSTGATRASSSSSPPAGTRSRRCPRLDHAADGLDPHVDDRALDRRRDHDPRQLIGGGTDSLGQPGEALACRGELRRDVVGLAALEAQAVLPRLGDHLAGAGDRGPVGGDGALDLRLGPQQREEPRLALEPLRQQALDDLDLLADQAELSVGTGDLGLEAHDLRFGEQRGPPEWPADREATLDGCSAGRPRPPASAPAGSSRAASSSSAGNAGSVRSACSARRRACSP